jgi:hypothetical protein
MGQASSTDEEEYKLRAWKSDTNYPKPSDYPENNIPELIAKPNTAIAFSGGSSRSYIAALGFLAGLRDLELLSEIRYMSGVNGGALATAIYCYGDPDLDDELLLGPIYPPEKITMEMLEAMDANCARRLTSYNYLYQALLTVSLDKRLAWYDAISEKFLKPVNIHPGKYFTWSHASLRDILRRNQIVGLQADDFILPRKSAGPYMILGWTFAGPERSNQENPYDAKYNQFRYFEVTPLYVGQFSNEYAAYGGEQIRLGGVIEPYGFSITGGQAPEYGLEEDELTGILDVPKPSRALDLTTAVSISSYNPGTVFDSYAIAESVAYPLTCNYWSPTSEQPLIQPTIYADGGAVQNIPLISFIQRGVEKIIAVSNSYTPINYPVLLEYNSHRHWWRTKHIRSSDIDITLASFFGILPLQDSTMEMKISSDYRRNHVFETTQFDNLIRGFREASLKGHGIICRQIWKTVDNPYYGIEAGREVDVTFVYLEALSEWDGRLKSTVRDQVYSGPKDAFTAATNLFQGGEEFQGFPHYDSNRLVLSHREANLIANLVGWSVIQNRDIFEDVLSHNPSPKNNKPFSTLREYSPSPVPKDEFEADEIVLGEEMDGDEDVVGPVSLDNILAQEEDDKTAPEPVRTISPDMMRLEEDPPIDDGAETKEDDEAMIAEIKRKQLNLPPTADIQIVEFSSQTLYNGTVLRRMTSIIYDQASEEESARSPNNEISAIIRDTDDRLDISLSPSGYVIFKLESIEMPAESDDAVAEPQSTNAAVVSVDDGDEVMPVDEVINDTANGASLQTDDQVQAETDVLLDKNLIEEPANVDKVEVASMPVPVDDDESSQAPADVPSSSSDDLDNGFEKITDPNATKTSAEAEPADLIDEPLHASASETEVILEATQEMVEEAAAVTTDPLTVAEEHAEVDSEFVSAHVDSSEIPASDPPTSVEEEVPVNQEPLSEEDFVSEEVVVESESLENLIESIDNTVLVADVPSAEETEVLVAKENLSAEVVLTDVCIEKQPVEIAEAYEIAVEPSPVDVEFTPIPSAEYEEPRSAEMVESDKPADEPLAVNETAAPFVEVFAQDDIEQDNPHSTSAHMVVTKPDFSAADATLSEVSACPSEAPVIITSQTLSFNLLSLDNNQVSTGSSPIDDDRGSTRTDYSETFGVLPDSVLAPSPGSATVDNNHRLTEESTNAQTNEFLSSSSASSQAPITADPSSPTSVAQLHSLDDIIKGNVVDMNHAKKEDYLDDETFFKVFGMDKQVFNALPKWKRDQMKKKAGLF